jgi:ribokinase
VATSLGVPFVLDPAPAQALSPETLRNVTWLTPNETETRAILKHLGHPMKDDAFDGNTIPAMAERILETGVRNLILKLGSRGIYLVGKDVPPTSIAPYRVRTIDTTAAGDAFNGGFAYGLTQGLAPIEAARFACAVAAVSVTREGAQRSMPTLAEVEALMNTPLEITESLLAN